MSSVLYDTPGPRAKRRNVVLSVVFVLLLALAVWWVWQKMDDKGQLKWDLWQPFTTSEAWTTYLLPGLGNTLKAAALAMVIALPLGAVFGIARMSDHAWVRIPAAWIVEFFRARDLRPPHRHRRRPHRHPPHPRRPALRDPQGLR
ncbi:hypothetical protein ACWCQR_16230, partial [Streptomyces sp. NPDC002172]